MTIKLLALTLTAAQLTTHAWSTHSVLSKSNLVFSSEIRHSSLCTITPGRAIVLLRVERDTLLPFAATNIEPMSASGVPSGPGDSVLVTAGTPLPAARVKLLNLDSVTRATLVSNGITDTNPLAFIRAAPYRADCRTIRWTDTIPFAVRGEVSYVRGTLSPRDKWIGGTPLFVVPDAWNYPYPRRRGLAFRVSPQSELAPAEAMFSLNALLEMPAPQSQEVRLRQDSIKRERAIEWANANRSVAEIEPVRTLVRRAVLGFDWEIVSRIPSRLRGTYRVDIEAENRRGSFFFRTHDRPGYSARGSDSVQTTSALLDSPHVLAYSLVGLAATSQDSLETISPDNLRNVPLVWLVSNDRPTAKDNDAQRTLTGSVEFLLGAAPESLWDDLEAFVPPLSAIDSATLARMNRTIPRSGRQARLPITLTLDGHGGVRGDTVLVAGTRRVRISLTRSDTLSVKRPF